MSSSENIPKKRALGRGLSALLKEKEDTPGIGSLGSIVELQLDNIRPNGDQPRKNFDQNALEELTASIQSLGVIQPVTVRKREEGYELISGERRFQACKLAGLDRIPSYVRIADDEETLEMVLVENIQREELNAIEIALSYQRLIYEMGLTQERLSQRIGKKRVTIANYLRLLKLDPVIQTGIRDKVISMGHGRALINMEDPEQQLYLYEKIIHAELSVRQTEALVKNHKKAFPEKTSASLLNELKKDFQKLSQHLNSPVDIRRSISGKGKIIISFHSDKDFDRIKELLL
ncbi:ParB/RepB/Spo0J family partition protein [Bacteroidetes bacterium endosymbiont of Geopemphigus sp.]|uniref:ParB/RepB/Spo0J family partition protein n=1 Tax=Bacteroidetes bacterium endosymbiont of Geopemphigus sp. TaxID=2047937 RepID=UPI000CD2C5BE|nr:ParB/RepB/Spo0J family partition protein [Bacteroidetes bacterium endosymbiont of Geopemphigus sp.]